MSDEVVIVSDDSSTSVGSKYTLDSLVQALRERMPAYGESFDERVDSMLRALEKCNSEFSELPFNLFSLHTIDQITVPLRRLNSAFRRFVYTQQFSEFVDKLIALRRKMEYDYTYLDAFVGDLDVAVAGIIEMKKTFYPSLEGRVDQVLPQIKSDLTAYQALKAQSNSDTPPTSSSDSQAGSLPAPSTEDKSCFNYLDLNGAFTSIPNGVKVYVQGFANTEFMVERSYFAQTDRYGSFVIYFDLKLNDKLSTIPQASITGLVPPKVNTPALPNGGE